MSQGRNSTGNELSEFRQSEIKVIVDAAMNEKFKNWKRTITFFAIAFLFVMMLLVAIGVWCIADLAKTLSNLANITSDGEVATITVARDGLLSADYLAAVIPLLLALGGSFIAFLGMNRLKMFDERIDQTRAEMLKEIESRVKVEVAVDRVEFSNQILQSVSSEQVKFYEAVADADKELLARKEKCISEIADKFDSFEKKYAWLEATVANKEADLDFHTVDDAYKLVERLRNTKPTGYISIIKKIVNRVCGDIELSGDSADYHNLAAETARGSMYIESCKVLKKGLCFFPKDTDLLSDLVEYATKGSMFDDAAEATDQLLNNIPRRLWTWRCYEFICDYYRAIGELEKADKLCDEFISAIPNDEHGYRSKAEIAKLLSPGKDGIKKSIDILQLAIDNHVNCPQCANALAETYLSIGEFDEALKAVNQAVLELAQDQPHVNVAYVFYNRAVIQDRMFMHGLNNSDSIQSLANNAYKDYNLSLSFHMLSSIVSHQAQVRIKILEQYVSQNLIQENGTDEDSKNLLSLLSQLTTKNGSDMETD